MDAILNKTRLYILFNILVCSTVGYAQKYDCNKEILLKKERNQIPREVCIPISFVISFVYGRYDPIDFNLDGYYDYVFTMTKKTRTIGDSTYLVFYKMNSDSTFTLAKVFGNIYPVYFDPNDELPQLSTDVLKELFDCYALPDPLYSLEVIDDRIIITRRLDGRNFEREQFVYKYAQSVNDWKLLLKKRYTDDEVIISEIKNGDASFLTKFSYCNAE